MSKEMSDAKDVNSNAFFEGGADATEIRRKYAHFQRLMTELMWDCLVGTDEHPVPESDVETHWISFEDGEPLKHTLHLPAGEFDEGEPIYNAYNKAVYVAKNVEVLPEIRARLEELARVQNEAKGLAGLTKGGVSKHLLYPELYEGAELVRYKRLISFDSHLRDRAFILDRLRRHLQDLKEVTAEKYAPKARFEDPVLEARYAEMRDVEAHIELITHYPEDEFRERRRYERVQPYVYFEDGSARQVYLKDVGFIVTGDNVEVRDDSARTRRRHGGKSDLAPLITFAKTSEVYSEREWREAHPQYGTRG